LKDNKFCEYCFF